MVKRGKPLYYATSEIIHMASVFFRGKPSKNFGRSIATSGIFRKISNFPVTALYTKKTPQDAYFQTRNSMKLYSAKKYGDLKTPLKIERRFCIIFCPIIEA